MSVTLKTSDELLPRVQPILEQLLARVRDLLPGAEPHHIGATAVPGSLTKGDIDILLRVSPSDFPVAVDMLKKHFQIKQPANWTPDFASFGDDTAYGLPVGIQVIIKDSSVDFLLFLRDHFITNPEVLAQYNRLKAAHANDDPEHYWKAKDEFLSGILAGRKS